MSRGSQARKEHNKEREEKAEYNKMKKNGNLVTHTALSKCSKLYRVQYTFPYGQADVFTLT